MTVAYILMAHEHLNVAAQLTAKLSAAGRPVAVHIDARAPQADVDAFKQTISGENIIHIPRRKCEWGMFSLVDATLEAAAALLNSGHSFSHVMLVSGADLPARPLAELDGFVADHPDHDIIEAVELSERRWVMDGLVEERFRLYHPFSWRRRRALFDMWVEVQRRLHIWRGLPEKLDLALGAQWWCLTRDTLAAILADPQLPVLKKFFRWTWIPDESFFQTLARRHGRARIGFSPTLSRFDPRGVPYVLYDDQSDLLHLSDHFFVRKVHPRADSLRKRLLNQALGKEKSRAFTGKAPTEEFARADRSRTHGRENVLSPARFKKLKGKKTLASAFPYTIIGGVGPDTSEIISKELSRRGDITCHGRLFSDEAVKFHGDDEIIAGCIPASKHARDFWPDQFVINVARGAAGGAVAFCLPVEDRYAIGDFLANDPGARVIWYRGAWALDLVRRADRLSQDGLAERARDAASAERGQLAAFRKAGAALTIRSAAELIEAPKACIADMLDVANARPSRRKLKPPVFAPDNWNKARPVLRFLQKSGCEIEAGLLDQHAGPEETKT
ncbi:MAG: beta-1,6-N-acetylglucosaminyltransferase [Pikeienuella sp.]